MTWLKNKGIQLLFLALSVYGFFSFYLKTFFVYRKQAHVEVALSESDVTQEDAEEGSVICSRPIG